MEVIDGKGSFASWRWGFAGLWTAVIFMAQVGALADPTVTVRHSFTGYPSDGIGPEAGLIADSSGNLYGTTADGGFGRCIGGYTAGCGVVFRLSPDRTEKVLYSLRGGSDGANPEAGLIADSSGNLYGTTAHGGWSRCGGSGCGTVFELTGTGFAVFAGAPRTPNCRGKSVSALAKQYGGLGAAAAALGFSRAQALQEAIREFCSG